MYNLTTIIDTVRSFVRASLCCCFYIDSVEEFRRLEITQLSSLGMVAFSELQQLSSHTRAGDKGSEKVIRGRNKSSHTDYSSQGEPCHNWNRGTCDKSSAKCIWFHICSKCKGVHKRGDCSVAKGAK
jgi:hypothetical protein